MALRDYLRDEELSEEDQIAMARESLAGLEEPDTVRMDFGIEETDPLPPEAPQDDLASFINEIAPMEQPPQAPPQDLRQMVSAQAQGPRTDIAPAQQYYDEVEAARSTGKPLDMLGGVLSGLAGRQVPRGPSFADIRGGARGMDLIRQVQENRAQRQYETQQGKLQREQSALDLTATQRQQGQGAQGEALLQVFPEMDPETAEALSMDPKAFSAMMRHGEQLRKEKNDAAAKQDERAYQEVLWKERQAIQQADKIALKTSGRRGGGGGRVRDPEKARQAAVHALRLRGVDEATDEQIENETAVQGLIGGKKRAEYFKQLATGDVREERGLRKETRKEATSLGADMSDLTDYRSNLATVERTFESLSDSDIAIMLASPEVKRAWDLPLQKAHRALKQFQNAILKVRSGAAVTTPEMERLREELGNTRFSNPKILREAFKQARIAFKAQERGIYNQYGDASVKEYQRRGGRDYGGGKEVTSKQYSPSRGKTRITYSDGSTEVVDGRQ